MIESKHCILLNEAGKRFVDESLGDEIVNQYLAKQENRRGFLLFEYVLLSGVSILVKDVSG